MKKRIVQWGQMMLAAVVLVWNSGCRSTPSLAEQQAGYPKEKVDARALYSESCAKCHGADGAARAFRGRLLGAQELTDPKWQSASTDTEIANAIKTGPKAMPAFETKLSSAEIEALVAYVRSFDPGQEAPTDAAGPATKE